MNINIFYEDGSAWACQTQTMGAADGDKAVASAGTVSMQNDALIYTAKVLDWETGAWRFAQGIENEYTYTQPFEPTMPDGRKLPRVDGTFTNIEPKHYAPVKYVLRTPEQLEHAVSITVDGNLTYAKEGGKLVSIMGGSGDSGSEKPKDFATEQRPVAHDHSGGSRTERPKHRTIPRAKVPQRSMSL